MNLSLRPILLFCGLLAGAAAVAQEGHRFTGIESCSTSGCHGGGAGHDQVQLHRRDQHAGATNVMSGKFGPVLAANLKIADARTSARCTVCHAPLATVPPAHFAPGFKPAPAGGGVSCESCHGPAEFWLRTHTRPDYTHAMRVQLGMRETKDLYARANVCIGCHQNLEPELFDKGHSALVFELDEYDTRPTAHWKDKGEWLGPRRWLTGQAVALREIAFMLGKSGARPGDGVKDLRERFDALGWLLRKTSASGSLAGGSDYAATQAAADRLARSAAAQSWTKEGTRQLFGTFAGLGAEFGKAGGKNSSAAAKRGFYLTVALNRLYVALHEEGGLNSPNIEKAIGALFGIAANERNFDGEGFGRLLQQIEIELAKG